MISREQVKDPKRRILMVCVQMFIEKGFRSTTMLDIIREADVSSGTFQNIFRTKDGVLSELTEFMFSNQFAVARSLGGGNLSPVSVYAVETAIQLAITEMNEHLREIYIEAYTKSDLAEYIYQKTSDELFRIFGRYNPQWTESDFYESEIGTAGMMRAFMAHPCDKYFTLKKKAIKLAAMAFAVYNVPEEAQREAFGILSAMHIEETATAVMKKLFSALEMTFDFRFAGDRKQNDIT